MVPCPGEGNDSDYAKEHFLCACFLNGIFQASCSFNPNRNIRKIRHRAANRMAVNFGNGMSS